MKLGNVILLSLSIASLLIGIHQAITLGIGAAYWLFMISIFLFLAFLFRKKS